MSHKLDLEIFHLGRAIKKAETGGQEAQRELLQSVARAILAILAKLSDK